MISSVIYTGIFDIMRPALEMTFGFNSIRPYSKTKLIFPKEATTPFLKEVTKRFYIKQGLSEKNWLLQYQQGKTGAIRPDVIDAIRETFIDKPRLAVSFLLPYLPDKSVRLNALKFTDFLKKISKHLKLLDVGGKAYNLLHTAIDIGTLSVRSEFRYKKAPVETNVNNNEDTSKLRISKITANDFGCNRPEPKFCPLSWPLMIDIEIPEETAKKIDFSISELSTTGVNFKWLNNPLPNILFPNSDIKGEVISELGRSEDGLTFHLPVCVRDNDGALEIELTLYSGGEQSSPEKISLYTGCPTYVCGIRENGEEICYDYNCSIVMPTLCGKDFAPFTNFVDSTSYVDIYEDGDAWIRDILCSSESFLSSNKHYCKFGSNPPK